MKCINERAANVDVVEPFYFYTCTEHVLTMIHYK